ncbi:MAG: protein-tyrosine phosphatase [Gaiellaceae bacterium]|jgi:protein tyrosine/serine phosphatase|nr:protein-tyrosine phosphatase [Gaiellaceae bacterium]
MGHVLERTLTWEGCLNVRDLGGHVTADGRRTRFGAVVRADNVRHLSAAGWEALVGHGVRRIVDLRHETEFAEDPQVESPVEVVYVDVMDERTPGIVALLESDATYEEFYLRTLELCHARWASAVAAVGDAPEGGVVVHCQAGKDRTGLVAALLLRLVGVSVEDIAADYGETSANLPQMLARWVEAAEDAEEHERRLRFLKQDAGCEPEMMAGTLAELERRYGSVREYLLAGGATEEGLARVRARLLDA